MVFLVGEANAKASGSNPTFGFVFVIPLWYIHEFKKSLLPLLLVQCYCFDEFKGTVRVIIKCDCPRRWIKSKIILKMLRFKILVNFS
jgi:hypothetical protein